MEVTDEESLPSAQECQERITQFVLVTNTDEALAQMRLQDNGWVLERALAQHFDDIVGSEICTNVME
jgi:hypothetical protein